MGRKKRKINQNQNFQEIIMKLINSKMWERVVLQPWVEKSWVRPGDSDYVRCGRKTSKRKLRDFSDYSFEEIHEKFLSFSKPKDQIRLFKCLKKLAISKLRKLFNENISFGSKDLSKDEICRSLVSKFYGEKPQILRRLEEKNHLEDLDDNSLFVKMCGKVVCKELVLCILSYLEFDSNLLFEIGRLNKTFYLIILSNWKKVTITKENLFIISLLVLRNVKCLEVKSSFNESEMDHLLKNLKMNKKLNKMKFVIGSVMTLKHVHKFLVYLKGKSSEVDEKSFFYNITEIEFQNDHRKDLLKMIWSLDTKLIPIFPNLKEVTNPLNFMLVGIDESNPEKVVNTLNFNCYLVNYNWKKHLFYELANLENSNLRKLSFENVPWHDDCVCGFVNGMLEECSNSLEEVKVSCESGVHWKLQSLRKCNLHLDHKLKKLRTLDLLVNFRMNIPRFENLVLLKLVELHHGIEDVEYYSQLFDFYHKFCKVMIDIPARSLYIESNYLVRRLHFVFSETGKNQKFVEMFLSQNQKFIVEFYEVIVFEIYRTKRRKFHYVTEIFLNSKLFSHENVKIDGGKCITFQKNI